jgi:hypothetical protein
MHLQMGCTLYSQRSEIDANEPIGVGGDGTWTIFLDFSLLCPRPTQRHLCMSTLKCPFDSGSRSGALWFSPPPTSQLAFFLQQEIVMHIDTMSDRRRGNVSPLVPSFSLPLMFSVTDIIPNEVSLPW